MTQPEVEADPVVPEAFEDNFDYHAEEDDYQPYFDHDHSALDVDYGYADEA